MNVTRGNWNEAVCVCEKTSSLSFRYLQGSNSVRTTSTTPFDSTCGSWRLAVTEEENQSSQPDRELSVYASSRHLICMRSTSTRRPTNPASAFSRSLLRIVLPQIARQFIKRRHTKNIISPGLCELRPRTTVDEVELGLGCIVFAMNAHRISPFRQQSSTLSYIYIYNLRIPKAYYRTTLFHWFFD